MNPDELFVRVKDLESQLAALQYTLANHRHTGNDKTSETIGDAQYSFGTVAITGTQSSQGGAIQTPFSIFDGTVGPAKRTGGLGFTKRYALGMSSLSTIQESPYQVLESKAILAAAAASGGDDSVPSFQVSSDSTQITIAHQPIQAGNPVQSFVYGTRNPAYDESGTRSSPGGAIVSGGVTLTDTLMNWDVDSLAGCILDLVDPTTGIMIEAKKLLSNTSTVITVASTWNASTGSYFYDIFFPVYFGSADFPWRRLYTVDDIRFGIGPSNDPFSVIFIKHGTASPESIFPPPQPGSLYLQHTGTTGKLYVLENNGGASTNTFGAISLSGATVQFVNDTTGFAVSGTFYVVDSGGNTQAIAYTGKTLTTFTGCSGGSGTSENNSPVWQITGWVAK